MPPRGFTNPAPKTTSAREALQSFYCELCTKGYSRMNEYEAHLSSYDHSHKQRLKDMRQLSRDPLASSKARKAEAKANAGSGLISIKLGGAGGGNGGAEDGAGLGGGKGGAGGGGGFKKSGFKRAGFVSVDGGDGKAEGNLGEKSDTKEERREEVKILREVGDDVESDTEDEGYEVYDPRFPTD